MPNAHVPRRNSIAAVDSRKLLVERVAASSYLNKSARLREMFLYLCERVLEQSADDIHEHEVGHKVFGRPVDYDSTADNIVRVHASMLRKRIDQYFANEGSREPIIIDIPKGNYAPVFRKRPESPQPIPVPQVPPLGRRWNWRMWVPIALAVFFAYLSIILFFRARDLEKTSIAMPARQVTVRQFWSQLFTPGKPADIVLDDASLGFFQELTAHPIALKEYYDRSYLQSVEQSAATAKLDRDFAEPLVLKRQSNYADVALLWKLAQLSGALQGNGKVQFARDYSFREIKADNVILLGNSRSNPWIEPFENHLGLRWKFDKSLGTYYPVDTAAPPADQEKFHVAQGGEPREGYATVSFLPNLSGSGKVLIISGTGGAAMGAALDFLSDESSIAQVRGLLPNSKAADFPYFETLLRVKSRSNVPRDTAIVICRPPQP
ncbi:MAG TPA: hypothetical protein VFA71_04670 [Terriglobales bacterium]|nr:hypothetical protein [Terriglobales bacterium]